jgi:prolyl-tRNA synthetase
MSLPMVPIEGNQSGSYAGVKTHADLRDNYTPGNKYAQWELKGMCVRLELGPKDMQNESVMSVRRDNGAKEAIPWKQLSSRMPEVLVEMQKAMFDRASARVSACMATV